MIIFGFCGFSTVNKVFERSENIWDVQQQHLECENQTGEHADRFLWQSPVTQKPSKQKMCGELTSAVLLLTCVVNTQSLDGEDEAL